MSASPADRTPGRTPGRTPNGGPTPLMRRPKTADPLVRPKDKQKRRPQRPPTTNGQPIAQMNGMRPPPYGHPQAMAQYPGRPAPPPAVTPSMFAPQPSSENAVSGWSSKPLAQVTDYPLVMSKKQIMEGFRHHVARFAARRPVDPRNTNEFVRPVRLHRRDPKAPPPGSEVKGEDATMSGMDALDDKEREKEEILRAEREAKKEAEAALVAPSVNPGGQKRLGSNLKKTEQVYKNDQTEEQKARSKLRYEEALPWHLEDFDNKSTWVGSYEAALSDTYAMMTQGPDKIFRIVPLEKWYKFTQKNQFKTLTIEEAETRFNKKIKEPRWFMDSEENKKRRQEQESNKKASSGLFLGKWEKGGGRSGAAAPVTKHENADADDLDFTEDRFADDEENMLFEEQEDDETKEAEERIKKDQLQANVFDLKEEKEYEKQEDLEKKEKEAEKKLGKHVKKALMKREKNYIYDSDSTDNPYSSESDSDSTETERAKEAEKAKADAANKTTPDTNDKSLLPKSKYRDGTGSGASSKGNNTPSHRPSKHPSPNPGLPRTSSTTSLKRPGSPLASDASENESAARKKIKKKHAAGPPGTSSSQPALHPPSRPGSPPNNQPPSSSAPQPSHQNSASAMPQKRPRTTAGSGSDSEGRAGSGGEMSDGTRKRIKLKLGMPKSQNSPNGSNTNSRAGSPDALPPSSIPTAGSATTAGSTNASVPGATTSSQQAAVAPPTSPPATRPDTPPFPTAEQVRARIPPSGIKMGELLAHFRGQIVGEERKGRFTRLMRENSRFVKETKMLVPLGE